jgi:hypothetical protein
MSYVAKGDAAFTNQVGLRPTKPPTPLRRPSFLEPRRCTRVMKKIQAAARQLPPRWRPVLASAAVARLRLLEGQFQETGNSRAAEPIQGRVPRRRTSEANPIRWAEVLDRRPARSRLERCDAKRRSGVRAFYVPVGKQAPGRIERPTADTIHPVPPATTRRRSVCPNYLI